MSNRDQIIQLLDRIPDYKTGYILAYMQGMIADEESDDLFCEQLYQNYLDDPDPDKDTTYTLEECKKEWGID